MASALPSSCSAFRKALKAAQPSQQMINGYACPRSYDSI